MRPPFRFLLRFFSPEVRRYGYGTADLHINLHPMAAKTGRDPVPDDVLQAADAARCAAQVLAWTARDTTERMLAEAVLDALRGVTLVSRCVHSRE